jgi:light-regulated signal transduction histidine kinase (bacteriophytochrome)
MSAYSDLGDRTAGPLESLQELNSEFAAKAQGDQGVCIQSGGYLLELSLDWIVLRASENVHHLLGKSHVTLIEEPIGRFVHAQALHDLRNLFSRLSGTTGIGRAYGVRLTDEHEFVDIAFQLSNGRALLEAVPSAGSFGEAFGTIGGLIAGLSDSHGQALLDGGARRMRALTGYDRVTMSCGDRQAESSRGAFAGPAQGSDGLPIIITDTRAEPIAIFPRDGEDQAAGDALMRSAGQAALENLAKAGIRSTLRVSFSAGGAEGEFRCDNRTPRAPSLEFHAAAELFAQMFALRLENDGLKTAD